MIRRGAMYAAICCIVMASFIGLASSAEQPRVLVLLDKMDMQQSHSKFLQSVTRGYKSDIAAINSKTAKLRDWDVWMYEKLVILGGKNKLGPEVQPSAIADFAASGHNIILAIGAEASSELRKLSRELGVAVAPSKTSVIDHFNVASKLDGDGDHTAILTAALAPVQAVFNAKTKGPVAFRGVGLSIPRDSQTAFAALTGSPTSYSSSQPGTPPPSGAALAGQSLVLVALVQARNNARVAIFGSTDMCSNEFYAGATGNTGVCTDISDWAFARHGALRVSPLRHRIVEGSLPGAENPAAYRINDQVEVAVDIHECADGASDSECHPFTADDMQIEFVMLDPYLRLPLQSVGNGTFTAQAKVPDVYGVFKWVVDYRRPGWSWVQLVETVPVRPYRHDEYERFIVQAYPYYASAAAMMAGFFVLSFVFMK